MWKPSSLAARGIRTSGDRAPQGEAGRAHPSETPKLGGLILALSDDPQSTRAWDTGALGEERLGNRLNELASGAIRVLHDRRIPGSRANIDHIAVARRVCM